MDSRYPLASSTWDKSELKSINKVIDSGIYSMGKFVAEFENKFSDYNRSKYSVMVNSGSSANLLAVAALFFMRNNPLKRGDEVIVPAVSWSTTYSPLQQYGLKLKFVDIDINTLNYDLDKLSNAVSDTTRLIVAVNLLGNPNDFDQIQKIINKRDIIVLEDNCESLGASYNSKKTGTIGLLGTFSSFFSHHISTMEGGVICTDNEELYQIIKSLRAHGWTRNLDKNNLLCKKSENDFEESFRFILPGYNVRPLEFSGAIGLEQLNKLPSFIDQRRKNHIVFNNLFKDDKRFILQKEIGKSSWFGFSMVLSKTSGLKRQTVLDRLKKNNIDYRPIVSGNFCNSESLKYYDYEIHETVENAEYIDKNGFFVGNHHYDLKENIEFLKKILSEI